MSPQQPLAYTSTIQFTVDGRPSVNDIHELFSTLILQLTLSTHRYRLRYYTNTFTSEEAIVELGSLKFSRTSDDASSTRIVTTFNMVKEMAKALLQQFLWTRLLENATEPQDRTYREKGLWRIRSKGLCVLQEFCTRTKAELSRFRQHIEINAELMYLINLERMKLNDRVNRNKKYMACLFTIMIASLPLRTNYREKAMDILQKSTDSKPVRLSVMRDFGIHELLEDPRKAPSINSSDSCSIDTKSRQSIMDYFPDINILTNDLLVNSESSCYPQDHSLISNLSPTLQNKFKMRAIFSSHLCCQWLVEYCTTSSTDEAEMLMTEFLKLGWITFFDRKNDHLEHVESSKSNILKLTRAGMNVIIDIALNQSKKNIPKTIQEMPLPTDYFSMALPDTKSLPDVLTPPSTPSWTGSTGELNIVKLKTIFKEPLQRVPFREFLTTFSCEEDLDFIVEYDILRSRCHDHAENQEQLFEDAYLLWDSYLRPGAHVDLNVHQDLKEEIAQGIVLLDRYSFDHLLLIIKWFDMVNIQLFRYLADHIPKFLKTPHYKKSVYAQLLSVSFELNDFPPPPSRRGIR